MGTILAKIDVKSAYCNIPIYPDVKWLMGLQWEGSLYIDTAVGSALKILTTVADSQERGCPIGYGLPSFNELCGSPIQAHYDFE